MERQLYSSNIYSHPDKLLEDHLKNVAELMDLFLSEKPSHIKNQLSPIIRIIGLSHDIGKATNSFQKYLFANENEKNKLKTQHSLFSAVVAYYLVKEINPENDFLPLFAYIAVRRHHGDLIDILDEVSSFGKNDANFLQNQLDDIDETKFSVLAKHLFACDLPIKLDKNIIRKWIQDFDQELKYYKKRSRQGFEIKSYIILNLLYSLLIDADKTDAVVGDKEAFERKNYKDKDWVKNFLSKFNPSQNFINQLRKKAYDEVSSYKIDTKQKIYSIYLPTGLGKTLTGFSFALNLKSVMKNLGVNPRIIYSLPFLSIIDQNAKVFEEVVHENGVTPTSDLLLKHHHLSEIYYKTEEQEYETESAKIFIEGWNTEIVITTFVQLFHTLLSNKNSTLRKFHRLANSIIILDEIQVIPIKYWKIINHILTQLSEMLNTYLIIMTATEPLIFEKNSTTALVKSADYYTQLNRIKIISNISQPTVITELKKEINISSNQTILFIFNTISSAKEFYNSLLDLPLTKTYLSTHIVPAERIKRIKEIKDRKYKIVVSTQLVEAGVDIDFDVVIRDIAPFDCIVQSAGRCNRNAQNNKGVVKVFKLINEKRKTFANRIYDPVLIDITEKILSQKDIFQELEIAEYLREYFNLIAERMSQTGSEEILEAVTKLRYDRYDGEEDKISVSDFKLIEEDYPKIDVFIEYDDNAEEVWEKFQKMKQIRNIFDRKKEFLKIRKDFYNYIISIPASTENLPPKIEDTYYVTKNQLEDYYDMETGYKTKSELLLW
jgi:CRISPR-associated endonuclease/helicase Cas3